MVIQRAFVSRTLAKLKQSIDQIIAFDRNGVLLVNTLVLGNLCEYRHESYIAKKWILSIIFLLQTIWVHLQPL